MARSRQPFVRPRKCSGSHAAGPYGSSRIESKSEPLLLNTPSQTGFSDPISPIIAPYFPFDLLRLRQPHDREQVYTTTGAR